jgi:hypothetical protein
MRRAVLSLVAGAVLLAGCGGSSPPSAVHTQTHQATPLHVVGRQTAKRLLAWVGRLRDCYRERELSPAAPAVTRRRVTIGVDPSVASGLLAGDTLACVSVLGKPPARASFRTERGRTVVSLPSGYALRP